MAKREDHLNVSIKPELEASLMPICDNTGVAHFNAHIDMKTADGSVTIEWAPSQVDMLAEDYQIVE